MADDIKAINLLLESVYYSRLSPKERNKKLGLYLDWRTSGLLDDDLLEAYINTKVANLGSKPEITNMLELSLHLGRLFHADIMIHNKEGLCVYDSIFNCFKMGD